MSERYERAVEAIQAGDDDRARQLLVQLLQDEPANEDGWLALATLLEGEERREALERVLELNPENKRARQQLALGTVESHELPEFEPSAEPPVDDDVEPPVAEPVPPAATAPPTGDPVPELEPLEPLPPSEAASPPAGVGLGSMLAGSGTVAPGAAARPLAASGTDDTVPLVLEIAFGVFGALGIGWLYAGNLIVGAAAFFGFMLLLFLEVVAIVGTVGFFGCLILPLNLLAVGFSAYKLRAYIRRHGSQGNVIYPVAALVIAAILGCVLFVLLFLAASVLGITASQIQQGLEFAPSP